MLTATFLALLLIAPQGSSSALPPGAVLIRDFAPPSSPYGSGHRGIDIAAEPGESVISWSDGTIAYAGTIAGKPVVTVRTSSDAGMGTATMRYTYEPAIAGLAMGTAVHAGQAIATVAARGGHCGGNGCLHVGLRTSAGYLDPRLGSGVAAHAVLRPWDAPAHTLP